MHMVLTVCLLFAPDSIDSGISLANCSGARRMGKHLSDPTSAGGHMRVLCLLTHAPHVPAGVVTHAKFWGNNVRLSASASKTCEHPRTVPSIKSECDGAVPAHLLRAVPSGLFIGQRCLLLESNSKQRQEAARTGRRGATLGETLATLGGRREVAGA